MSDPAQDQRRRAAAWRHIVATVLRSLGVDAEAVPPSRRPSEEFTPRPDVIAPELGCFVKASPIQWSAVSGYLSRAQLDADDRGLGETPCLIKPAPAAPPEDAYVIMRLADFAPLARDAELWRSLGAEGGAS